MKNQGKRISILSLPEAREFYSIPKFTPQEREYFFTFTDETLDLTKRFNKVSNRVHFLLICAYFKVKKVSLLYGWKDHVGAGIKYFQRFCKYFTIVPYLPSE